MKRIISAALAGAMVLSAAVGASADIADVSGDYGEVKLAPYTGLEVERYVYDVTDDDVEYYIENLLYDYADYNEVDRESQDEDILSVYMTASIDGESVIDNSEEEETIYLGYEDYGAEFDEALTGVKTGDVLEFSVSYDADDEYAMYPGETVDYNVTVNAVYEMVIPELTDEFITETLGYDSEDAMREAVRAEIEEENLESSNDDAKSSLLQQVVDASEIVSYNDEDLEAAKEYIESEYESYVDLFGAESIDEIYEMFEVTDEDIDAEALNYLYEQIVVKAIAQWEGVEISDEEFNEGAEYYAELNYYDSVDEFIEAVGEDAIMDTLIEDKVLGILLENAVVTDVEYSDEEETEDYEDDSEVAEDDDTEAVEDEDAE